MQEQLDRIEKKLDMALHGPDGSPSKGIYVRLDRLEIAASWAIKLAALAFIGAISAVWNLVWSAVTKRAP